MSWFLSPIKSVANAGGIGNVIRRPIHVTSLLLAEPPKKKKKEDPALVMQRAQRKSRRIEKEIKRFEKRGRSLKPVEELEGDLLMKKEIDKHRRDPPQFDDPVAEEVRRSILLKRWSRFKTNEMRAEERRFNGVVKARNDALAELKALCPTLHAAAVEFDESLIPSSFPGPVLTPPVKEYSSPDGVYSDLTPSFKYAFEIDRKFIVNPKDKRKKEKGQA